MKTAIRNWFIKIYKFFLLSGFDARRFLNTLRYTPTFIKDLIRYSNCKAPENFKLRISLISPVLNNYKESAGQAGGHYFHQDLWAARRIFKANPGRHVDIGSRIDGFIAHLLVFRPVEVIDIRKLESNIQGLNFIQADATSMQQFESNSLESISCLHAAEHFGLGRYGDPIDPMSCFKFMSALERVLALGGRLYFSVPIGRERLEFNNFRVFTPLTILKSFPKLTLKQFSFVGDDGELRENVRLEDFPVSDYACGLFEFTK